MPGRAAFPRGPDDGHGARGEQALHRARLGPVLTVPHDLQRGPRLGDGEGQLDVALGELAGGRVAGGPEDAEHRPVGRQDVGGEAGDPPLARRAGQVLQQQRTQAPALVAVLHDEGDLRVLRARKAVVADHADDRVVEGGDQRHPVVVVDLGEAGEVGVRQHGAVGEEAVVDGLLGQPRMEGLQSVGVLGQDRSQVHRPAVGQDDVGLPAARVVGHACSLSVRGVMASPVRAGAVMAGAVMAGARTTPATRPRRAAPAPAPRRSRWRSPRAARACSRPGCRCRRRPRRARPRSGR